MRTLRPVLLGALTLSLLIGGASAAHAQSDDERARRHFEAGQSYYQQASYEDAIREWEEAYRLSNRSLLLLNLSQAYERNLQFDEAISHLQRYLDQGTGIQDRHTHEIRLERLHELRDRMQREGGSTSEGTGPPDGPTSAAGGGPPSSPSGSSSGGGLTGLGIAGLVIAGVGVASGIVAIITGAVSQGTYSDLESRCGPDGVCPPGSQPDIDSGQAMAITSTVLSGVAIVGAGVGVALLVVDLTSGDDSSEVALAPGPGEAGVSLQGSF